MRSPLILAVAQPRCRPYDVAANAGHHAAAVEEAGSAGARVVVFPELSLTGYHFDATPVAPDDPRLDPLVEACAATDTLALVGAPVTSTSGRHIGVLAVGWGTVRVAYHKMHLGAAEQAAFTPGIEPRVIAVDGWRIGLAVCKDTGVPEHADLTARLGVDIYAAGVLESADDAHVQPERARAVVDRHGIWVAVASFAGTTGEGYDQAAGGSAVWGPDGRLAASAGPETGAVAIATITDHAEVTSNRGADREE